MKKILLFGEILFDIFKESKTPGGAPFNVACHLARLSNDCCLVSAVGNDDLGTALKKIAKSHSLNTDYVQTKNKETGIAQTTLDSSGSASFCIKPNVAYDHIEKFPDDINKPLIYYGTLAQRSNVSAKTLQLMLKKYAKESLNFCDINLREPHYSEAVIRFSLQNADILKINESELDIVAQMFNHKSLDLLQKAQDLSKKFDISQIIITMGENGAALIDNGNLLKFKASKVEKVVDTVGAGDAFSAMFINCLIKKIDIVQAMNKSIDYSAKVCQIRGAIYEN